MAIGFTASLFFLYQVREVPLAEACTEKAEKLKKQLEDEKKITVGTNSNIEFSEDEDNLEGVHLSKQRIKKV